MAKQSKKKQKTETQATNQRNHNKSTRGINSKKKGALWALRQYKTKEDGKEVTKTREVRVPCRTLFNPFDRQRNSEHAAEPFDALSLDWREELVIYAAEMNARLGSVDNKNGTYVHRVYRGETVNKPDEILLELESSKKLILEKKGPRRRSRRKKA